MVDDVGVLVFDVAVLRDVFVDAEEAACQNDDGDPESDADDDDDDEYWNRKKRI